MGRSHTPSWDGTFLLPPEDLCTIHPGLFYGIINIWANPPYFWLLRSCFYFFFFLCISTLCRAKHINKTGCNIFNFYVENQSCNPYQCAMHVTMRRCIKLLKYLRSQNVLKYGGFAINERTCNYLQFKHNKIQVCTALYCKQLHVASYILIIS